MRKKIFIIIGGLLLLAAIWVIYLVTKSSTISMNLSKPIATNIRYPFMPSDNEFYYFSGSSFIKYNLNEQKTVTLSSSYRFPTINKVIWSKTGALFLASDYAPADQLYDILIQNQYNIEKTYWWAINFNDSKVQLIGSYDEIEGIIWQQNSNDWIMAKYSEGSNINIYKGSFSVPETFITNYSGINNILWANQSYLIATKKDKQRNTKVFKLNITNKKEEQLFDIGIAEALRINLDGNKMVYIDISKMSDSGLVSGPLVFTTSPRDKQIIDKNFSENILWSSFSDHWAGFNNKKGNSIGDGYYYIDNKARTFDISRSKENTNLVFSLAAVGINQLLLLDENNTAYLASQKVYRSSNYKDPSAFQDAALNTIYQDNYTIAYFPDRAEYQIIINKNPYQANKQKAFDYIKNYYKLDPNQLNIIWIPADSVNPGT